MALSSPPELEMYYIRDAKFSVYIRFNRITPDEQDDWTAKMVLRRQQSDNSPALTEITGVWQTADPDYPDEALAYFEMNATTTSALPQNGCVYYVDLIPDSDTLLNERAIQGQMIAGD